MQNLQQVVDFLKHNELVLATAESCTAGLIASLVAEVPGSGAVMECGYVVYAISAKREMLGVSLQTIDSYGLTSEPVAREMALGALQRCGAGITLANTGLAEAQGEMDGVICFACAMLLDGQPRVLSETRKFDGRRNEVRAKAARHALLSLERYVDELRQTPPRQN
ncbi:CinA family protein [Pseudomonas sp. MYb185]|uniref:CinA family protein n=1 Tax=Pseudomonas sp. MYb185 TaxID=1848729 RepID=UPI000CFAD299|nr:CinA family protein [Pseudomonas sp. MYb185]PRB80469.1 ompetence-damaged protein [Pseudomonas sp. MYb185]